MAKSNGSTPLGSTPIGSSADLEAMALAAAPPALPLHYPDFALWQVETLLQYNRWLLHYYTTTLLSYYTTILLHYILYCYTTPSSRSGSWRHSCTTTLLRYYTTTLPTCPYIALRDIIFPNLTG